MSLGGASALADSNAAGWPHERNIWGTDTKFQDLRKSYFAYNCNCSATVLRAIRMLDWLKSFDSGYNL